MQQMLDAGVSTRRGVMNAHLELPYQSTGRRTDLSHSEHAQQRGVILPLAPAMTVSQVHYVCDQLAAAVAPVTRGVSRDRHRG